MIFQGIEIFCPHCRGGLESVDEEKLACMSCQKSFPVVLGIPDLRIFPDPYIDAKADREKGIKVAARFDELSFSELVEYYYSITSVVPPAHARQYARGLLSAEARAKASLASWERVRNSNGSSGQQRLLEVGCGTAPLLVAAATRYAGLVGVDIAFRWLVVAKKRLAAAGLEIPLICACAEALPFASNAFDRVVADSVLENVKDQQAALTESYRVLCPGGRFFLATPNRFSLGPDPHAGIWAGGYLPQKWLAAHVTRQGGIPPKRRLLSVRSLRRLIGKAGFSPPDVFLPDISAEQRDGFGAGIKLIVNLYHFFKRLPVSRQALHLVGPLLHAVAQKPVGVEDDRETSSAQLTGHIA